jgi:hypothetical protein
MRHVHVLFLSTVFTPQLFSPGARADIQAHFEISAWQALRPCTCSGRLPATR